VPPTIGENQAEVELLVDTGSMITVIPHQVLEKLGIKPLLLSK
jgi:predicted aspartyl protease